MGFCCRKHFAYTGFYDILVCDSFMHLFARHMCSWFCLRCLHADSHAAEARPLCPLRPERAPCKCWADVRSMYNYYVTHVSSWSLWQRGTGFCCRKHFAYTGFYDIVVCDIFMHLFARHMCSWLCFHCLHADSHAAEARPLRPLRPERAPGKYWAGVRSVCNYYVIHVSSWSS